MPGRREVLAGASGALALGGCDRMVGAASRWLGADLPARVAVAEGPRITPERHLLSRAAFGPWPGDEARVRAMGVDGWIDEQLEPDGIDDAACEVRTGTLDVALVPSDLIFEVRPEHLERQLVAHTLLRAVYSRRQLQEVLVAFWSDHFHVHLGKAECRHLTALHVREVIRRHALGRFRDLLRAVVCSPAMLVYLDGRDNAVERPGDVPNENYARELLELHTLGVRGGYTQRDVMEAARCLTGWVVRERWAPGRARFVPARHDDGEKTVLGRRIPAGGGAHDLDRLLDVVTRHPSCAGHVATRLCRQLVADDPPATVVTAAADAFARTDGDLRAVVRAILRSEAFAASAGLRVKRPFRFVVSTLRALAADTHARGDLQAHIARMGQSPHDHPTPDGYPLEGEAFLGTLLSRWRFAVALADGGLDDTRADLARLRRALGDGSALGLWRHLVGRDPDAAERAALASQARDGAAARTLALVLSSPGYQTC
ncbi:MAG TPA: DUF1800 domain-containing protein [Sandaracinaceae bacterium LLY-WYZ-13_1]|nr:DUF1800 domain-containing protein [Sandaracinaceae bacterium LLY-WYZ-13_1]